MTWLFENWRLVLLGLVVAVLAYMRIEVGWLRSRLDRAQARAKELKSYRKGRIEADEVDQSIGGDPAAAREYLRNRKP